MSKASRRRTCMRNLEGNFPKCRNRHRRAERLSKTEEAELLRTKKALLFLATEWWKGLSPYEIVAEQLVKDSRLRMPFKLFHGALEEVLGREVQSGEIGSGWKNLVKEFKRSLSAKWVSDYSRGFLRLDEAKR